MRIKIEKIVAEFEKHSIWNSLDLGSKASMIAGEIERDILSAEPQQLVKFWGVEFKVPAGTVDFELLEGLINKV